MLCTSPAWDGTVSVLLHSLGQWWNPAPDQAALTVCKAMYCRDCRERQCVKRHIILIPSVSTASVYWRVGVWRKIPVELYNNGFC